MPDPGAPFLVLPASGDIPPATGVEGASLGIGTPIGYPNAEHAEAGGVSTEQTEGSLRAFWKSI